MGDAFDVVVIGGGPAGGHCARTLAAAGRRVLLAERVDDFADNDFSSAGVPIETMTRFGLPESVIGRRFSALEIISTTQRHTWPGGCVLGAVLDFAALRRFLAAETTRLGGTVHMGCRYVGHRLMADGRIEIRLLEGVQEILVTCQVVVDATGAARAVMRTVTPKPARPYFTATGIEHLIEVPPELHARYADRLVFFLGHHWAPGGYGWIFPMGGNRLKVGSSVFDFRLPHRHLAAVPSVKTQAERLLREHLGLDPAQVTVLDTHGGVLRISEGLKDCYHHEGVLSIGDAVSCVNPLGGEGIRHGMECAEIAARHLEAVFAGKSRRHASAAYRREMLRRYRLTWNISLRLARAVYRERSDAVIDSSVRRYAGMDAGHVMDLLFRYSFAKLGWAMLMRWLRSRWVRLAARSATSRAY